MTDISKSRFYIGVFLFFAGFVCPLFIPIVTRSDWSTGLKTAVSGFLALGAPEIIMIIAVGILGKDGYAYLKNNLLGFLHKISPDEVTLTRYRIGLVFFIAPLIAGWLLPYLSFYFESFRGMILWIYIAGDVLFLSSFIILGGNFWDKFRELFVH